MLDTPLTLSQIILYGFFAYVGYNIYTALVEFNNRVKKIAEFTGSINRLMQMQVHHNPNIYNPNNHNLNNNNDNDNDNQNWWSIISSYLAQNPNLSNNLINVYVNAIRGIIDMYRNYFQNNNQADNTGGSAFYMNDMHDDTHNHVEPPFGLAVNYDTDELLNKTISVKGLRHKRNPRNIRNTRKTNMYNRSNDFSTCPFLNQPVESQSVNVKNKKNDNKVNSVLCDLIVESDSEQHSDVSDKESVCSLRIDETITKYKKRSNNRSCSEEPIQINI